MMAATAGAVGPEAADRPGVQPVRWAAEWGKQKYAGSNMAISENNENKECGAIRMIFAFMAYLIATGVVITWARWWAWSGKSAACRSPPHSGNCGGRHDRQHPGRAPGAG
jgi:hypothetical protein